MRHRILFYVLGAIALVYAFLAGLKTIAEFDLGWQMATARWIVQHHQIPSVDVLSYTAAGQPWIYPIGAGLIFYAFYLLGGYSIISWLAALASVAAVALLLRRGSAITAALAILAVPLITSRTTPRAEMFTVLLFATTLSLLWEQHETGRARLWLLPVLMIAWVNLHPGFIAGLALLGAYVVLEISDMLVARRRPAAFERLRRSGPWLAATCAATLLNPWGWNVFQVLLRQESAMATHSQLIMEWAPIPLNWAHWKIGLNLADPDEFYVLLLVAVCAIVFALWRRQFGAAILLAAVAYFPILHMRFTALFSIVIVIAGSAMLAPLTALLRTKMGNLRFRQAVAIGAAVPLVALAVVRSANVVTNRTYLGGTNLVAFGTGLSWWFPERAAAFVDRERLPGRIFSSGSEGAYVAFRLGPQYQNYIDGRAIPFGQELMLRSLSLKATPPDSPAWQQEVERFGINTILLPIGRFGALQFFPVMKQFCESDSWSAVYLDEVSVVFLRRTPETEPLIQRLHIDCGTAPLPAGAPAASRVEEFNRWANAASVLRALGRGDEALAAIAKALDIFPASGYLHFVRGHMYEDAANPTAADRDFRTATKLEPNLVAPWSALAAFDEAHGQLPAAIRAWQTAADVSRWPWEPLKNLGFAELQARRPKDALKAFNQAERSLPARHDLVVDNTFLANIEHGRARCWYRLGDLSRAISFEENAAKLLPDVSLWMQLASLYDAAGRREDAERVRTSAIGFAHPSMQSMNETHPHY